MESRPGAYEVGGGGYGQPEFGGATARRGTAGPQARTVFEMPIGWTVFEIPSTPGCLKAVRLDMCGLDLRISGHLKSVFPAGARGPAAGARGGGPVARPLGRSGNLLTSPATTATSGGAIAIIRVRDSGGMLHQLGVPARLARPGAARTGRADAGTGGDRQLRALELARQQRRTRPERVPAAVLLRLRGRTLSRRRRMRAPSGCLFLSGSWKPAAASCWLVCTNFITLVICCNTESNNHAVADENVTDSLLIKKKNLRKKINLGCTEDTNEPLF